MWIPSRKSNDSKSKSAKVKFSFFVKNNENLADFCPKIQSKLANSRTKLNKKWFSKPFFRTWVENEFHVPTLFRCYLFKNLYEIIVINFVVCTAVINPLAHRLRISWKAWNFFVKVVGFKRWWAAFTIRKRIQSNRNNNAWK